MPSDSGAWNKGRWKQTTEATGKRLHLRNWGTLRVSNTNVGRYAVWKKALRWSYISIFSTVLVGKKCSRLERVKGKIDLSLRIVTYAGFRFSSSKYTKAHLENHFKVTFSLTYPSFHTNFWSFLLSSCKNLTLAQFVPSTGTSRGNLRSAYLFFNYYFCYANTLSAQFKTTSIS